MSEEAEDDDWFEQAVSGDADAGPELSEEHASDDEGPDEENQVDEPDGPGDDDPGDGEDGLRGDSDSPGGVDVTVDSEGDLDSAAEDAFAAAQAGAESGEDNPLDGSDGESSMGGSGDESPFDDGADDGASLFDDDFESDFDSAGGDKEFEDDEFETDIPRIDLGIEGLDGMIQGGVPERHLIVTIGSAGTGKTTFGLQFLNHGLKQGENAIFIALEQSHDAIMATAAEWGWEFEKYEATDQLAVVDLDPVEMANSLENIRAELPSLIENFDADRLVLDSVSLLEMMYDDQAKRRTEVFDFTRSLKRAGVTTMLTSEANEDNSHASRHGIIEYLTDAVFVLRYIRGDTQETRLAVEIQKIRNANHSRETKPYEITMDGISVYQQANIF